MAMKLTWRDIIAAVLAVTGGIVFYAKLHSYSWALIGSWKGALVVIAVIGLGILVTYLVDFFRNEAMISFGEMVLWAAAGTVVIASLLATTTEAMFIWSSGLIGL